MLWIYNLAAILSLILLSPLLVFKLWNRRNYRAGLRERFGFFNGMVSASGSEKEEGKNRGGPCFWFHAVSVGETMAALPLVRRLRERHPDARIVFSTFTPTGRQVASEKLPEADGFFYFPLDVPPIPWRAISRIRPSLFVLVETDIWPNIMWALSRKNIPSVLVNGRISNRRLFAGIFYRQVLRKFSFLCVQSEVDREKLVQLGVDPARVEATGNMKFAQAVHRQPVKARRADFGLPESGPVLIAGSTHEGEEREILRCFAALKDRHPDLSLLLVPRHPERTRRVKEMFEAEGIRAVRRSRLNGSSSHRVVILDTLGELVRAYEVGTFIFVGGSFVRRGGHNVLEPAAASKPVFFGPHMENYSGIAETLEREGGAVKVRNGADLADWIGRLAADEKAAAEMGRKAAAFVSRNQGTVDRNLAIIERVLEESARETAGEKVGAV